MTTAEVKLIFAISRARALRVEPSLHVRAGEQGTNVTAVRTVQ